MRSPRALTSLGGPRSPTQLHRNGSASQGQGGEVDSGGSPTGRCPSTSSRVPWANSTLSSVGPEPWHHVVHHELLGQFWSRRRPWPLEGLPEHVQHLAKSILVLNSVTLTDPTSSSRRRGRLPPWTSCPWRGPLSRPWGAWPSRTSRGCGSRSGGSRGLTSPWSVVVHGVVHDDDLTLQSLTSTRSRVLPTLHQFTFQPERLCPVPHAGPPTYQDHEDQCQLTFLLLPFPLTTPSLFTSLTGLSLANSISPSAPFQRDDVEKPLTIPTFPYYLPKIPTTAVVFNLSSSYPLFPPHAFYGTNSLQGHGELHCSSYGILP